MRDDDNEWDDDDDEESHHWWKSQKNRSTFFDNLRVCVTTTMNGVMMMKRVIFIGGRGKWRSTIGKRWMVTDILKGFENGELSLEEAAKRIGARRATIEVGSESSVHARLDSERTSRTGVPEVIFGEGKSIDQMVDIFRSLKDSNQSGNGAMATRVSRKAFLEIRDTDPNLAKELTYYSDARICVLKSKYQQHNKETVGKIAVVCAGTSDVPVFEEAAVSSELLTRAHVERVTDVGVAGIHRLFSELPRIEDADVVIVCAGMDGALPSVIGGLVSCPVIAVRILLFLSLSLVPGEHYHHHRDQTLRFQQASGMVLHGAV